MRYLVLSDLHANIDALEAVLESVKTAAYDGVVVLGDLVGYGAEPNLVVERVRALEPVGIIRGNHDKVAAGLAHAEAFNPSAQRAVEWTRRALSADTRQYLAALPEGPAFLDGGIEICHGSPLDEDAYIFGEMDAAEALLSAERPLCLFGHTHLPTAAALDERRRLDILFRGPRDEHVLEYDDGRRYLVNPGSVGQPRDGDPRAACALVDTEGKRLVIRRVEYAVERARDRILKAGLPKALGNRLLLGR
jgi:predicted phosphodiesterase